MEDNTWEKEEDLKNAKKLVAEFEKRMNTKIRQQEKLDIIEEKDFRKEELPKKYIAKMLYR